MDLRKYGVDNLCSVLEKNVETIQQNKLVDGVQRCGKTETNQAGLTYRIHCPQTFEISSTRGDNKHTDEVGYSA